MTLRHGSPAFVDGTPIPTKYTCEGEDISPPLVWSGIPNRTKSLVFIVDDPDAPDPKAPKTIWVHWVLYNLPPGTTSLAEGVKVLPQDAKICLNDWKRYIRRPVSPDWSAPPAGSPVPPERDRHPQAQGLIPRPMPWAPPVTAAAVEVDPVGPAGLRRAEAYSAAVV